MQVLSMMSMQGDPEELQARLQKISEVSERLAPKYGGIASTVVKTDDGIMILNLWADEEGRHKMAEDPEIQQGMNEAGMRPDFKAYEVIMHRAVQ
jgi:hypothetical protein